MHTCMMEWSVTIVTNNIEVNGIVLSKTFGIQKT